MSLVGSGLVRVYMCSVLSPPPSILCVCMYSPAASRLCLFEKLAALSDGPNGWTPGNPNMQALKLPSRPACPMQLQFLPISHVPAHLHLSNCSSFTHLSLVRDPPRSHSLPTAAQSIESTSSVHLTALQEIHWIVEKGARLITR